MKPVSVASRAGATFGASSRPAPGWPRDPVVDMLLTLDLATVLGFSAVLAAMAALLLLATWRAAGRPAWLAAWAGFCGFGALAFGLHALRGLLPEPLLIFGATPLYASPGRCSGP